MNRKLISGGTLKIIAVITMFMDHFGQIVLNNGLVMNAPYSMFSDTQFNFLMKMVNLCHVVGRLAFPLFCFLIVEGFLHTHNLRKYIFQLGIFAIVSEPVYDLAFSDQLIDFNKQNVLFTLILGLLTLLAIKKYKDNFIVAIVFTTISGFLSYIGHFDGWYYGVIMITVFYLFRNQEWLKYCIIIIVMYLCGLDYSIQALVDPYLLVSVASLILLFFYNGKRGINLKYFFYLFYPVHLLILFVITNYILAPIL